MCTHQGINIGTIFQKVVSNTRKTKNKNKNDSNLIVTSDLKNNFCNVIKCDLPAKHLEIKITWPDPDKKYLLYP